MSDGMSLAIWRGTNIVIHCLTRVVEVTSQPPPLGLGCNAAGAHSFAAGLTTAWQSQTLGDADSQPYECTDSGFDDEGEQEPAVEATPYSLSFARRRSPLTPKESPVATVNRPRHGFRLSGLSPKLFIIV